MGKLILNCFWSLFGATLMLLLCCCTSSFADNGYQELGSKLATASVWANLRKKEGSINLESERMLSSAFEDLSTVERPGDICKLRSASNKHQPLIVLQSVPNKRLKNYADVEKCAALLAETSSRPIVFTDKSFSDLDALNNWVGKFSRGKGKDGKALYSLCDGKCSPQYRYLIGRKANSGYMVDAEVICGHARDKSDNQYRLSYGYLWPCTKDLS